MGLEIVTASTDGRLTTLETFKHDQGLSTSLTSDDDRLGSLIDRASAWAERYVGYPLSAARYRETVAGYGGRRLMLKRTPIVAVRMLCYGTDTGDPATEVLPSTEFGVEAGPGFLTRRSGWEWSVPVAQDLRMRPDVGQEFQPWLVDYVAGFSLVGLSTDHALYSTEKGTTSTGRTLPADIEAAVLTRAGMEYTGTLNVMEKKVGDLVIKYGVSGGGAASGSAGIDDPATNYLKPWRRTA